MNKKDWQVSLKKLKDLHKTCEANIKTATDQKEELEIFIASINKKIETFKTNH